MSPKLDAVFNLPANSGALKLGAEVDRQGWGGALRYEHRIRERAALFGEGFVERDWGGPLNFGARGGLEVRF